MSRQDNLVDPWADPDPALSVALHELEVYRRRRSLARNGSRIVEILLLVTTATTTLAAALGAVPWVVASLGASSVVIAGMRNIFRWRENWETFATAWSQLRAAIHEYRLLPEESRSLEARRKLVQTLNDVVSAEIEIRASRQRNVAD